MNLEQFERYQRHLQLPEVGLIGQQQLLDARIACVGVGGLAATVLLYLQAAGVGSMTLIESDGVTLSNLQRQIIFDEHHIGINKAIAAREQLLKKNQQTQLNVITQALTQENSHVLCDHDIIIDCTDNLTTRYLINQWCFTHNIPFVFASVAQWHGLLCLFNPIERGCFHCLFPTPTQTANNCNDAGVFGVLPGIMGLLQANVVLQFLLGINQYDKAQLYRWDCLDMSLKQLRITADPQCAVCLRDVE